MSSRQERKEAARERREVEEAAALTASRRRRIQLVAGGVAAIAVVAVALVVALGGGDDDPRRGQAPAGPAVQLPAREVTSLDAAVRAAGGKQSSYDWDDGKSAHTTDPVDYEMNPPTNGPHAPVWAADGNYVGRDTPVIEQLVHALEHGRIEIQYRPGLPAEQVAQLEALYEEDSNHMLLFQNSTGMEGEVAATAWGHALVFDEFTPAVFDAIRAFRDRYRDKGPEYVA